MTDVRRTRRWRGIVVVALAAGAVGLLFKRPFVLLASVVGVAFAAYPRVPTAPEVGLEIERSLGTDTPRHGDAVEVTARVRNVGDATLPDLRLVDGVPPMLSVREGTPRHAATLRPGEVTEFSYAVTARHGTHRFEPATAIARDVAGATEVETTVAAETTIECLADVPEVPLRAQARGFVGRLLTDEGGSGVEFHRTREYRHGDALNRIDWRRFARTGELATTEFRRERAAAVALVVDAREPAYRGGDDEPHGVAYALAATEQVLGGLAGTPDAVGIASLDGREAAWLAPATGTDHAERARELLSTHPALSTYPPAEPAPERWDQRLTDLGRRLSPDTQVVLLSTLPDGFAVEAALTLEAAGHAVTVVSPDVTTGDTAGGRLARVERENRVFALRESGVRVVDWDTDEPLGTALVRAQERWSR